MSHRHTPAFASDASPTVQWRTRLRRLSRLVFIVLLTAWLPSQARGQDDEYLRIFNVIEQADELVTKGKQPSATAKYQEAQTALQELRTSYPTWNSQMVSYRLKYVAEKIQALTTKTPPEAPAATPGITAAQTTPKGTADSSISEVTLLEAGAEPRKELRLHPKAGDQQKLTLGMNIGMEIKMGDVANQAMKLPGMKMVMDLTIKSVSPEGDITYDMVMSDVAVKEDPNAMPQVVEAMKSSVSALKGLSGVAVVTSQGVSKSSKINVPPSADQQIRQAMDQMNEAFSRISCPLPKEAVGPGAKWVVKMPVKSQGMTIQQEAKYELLSVEGDLLNLSDTITQSAANQKMQNPVMPGLKMDLVKMTGQSTGKVTVDLTKVVPLEGKVTSHTDTSMSMEAGGQKQAMSMKMDMEIQLEGK